MTTEEKKSESLLSRFKRVRITNTSEKKGSGSDTSPVLKKQTPEKKRITTPLKGRSRASSSAPGFSPFNFPAPSNGPPSSDNPSPPVASHPPSPKVSRSVIPSLSLSSARPRSPSQPPPRSASPLARPSSPATSARTRPPSPKDGSRPPSPRSQSPRRTPTPERERRNMLPSPRPSSPSSSVRRSIGPVTKKVEIPNMKEILEAMQVLKDPKSPLLNRRDAVAKLNDILDEDSAAILQRLRVLLHPLQEQLKKEVEISKDLCGFLQNLARSQVQENLNPTYVYFANQVINQLLSILAHANAGKRDFVKATLDRLVDCTKTKDTLNILLCCQHTQQPSQGFLIELAELVLRAIQNWGPEFFKSRIYMLVAPLIALLQSKSENVQNIAVQCVKQMTSIAPVFEKRVTEKLPFHIKAKITGSTDIMPSTRKNSVTIRKTPNKKFKLVDFKKQPSTDTIEQVDKPVVRSKTPAIGSTVEISGMKLTIEKLIYATPDESGGIYRVYSPTDDTRYAYKIASGDKDASELNSLLSMQGSDFVIKVINSDVEDNGTIHMITELGETNMEDFILDNWDKWSHNKIRSLAEEIFFAIRDVHMASLVHGDVTPRNFIYVKGCLKLIDFGVARIIPPNQNGVVVTINQMKGSPDFLPPEVFRVSSNNPFEPFKCNYGLDLWAAGVILHLMATGLTPFVGMSDAQVAGLTEMPQIKNLGSPTLQDLLSRILAFNPNDRISLDEPFFAPERVFPSIISLQDSGSAANTATNTSSIANTATSSTSASATLTASTVTTSNEEEETTPNKAYTNLQQTDSFMNLFANNPLLSAAQSRNSSEIFSPMSFSELNSNSAPATTDDKKISLFGNLFGASNDTKPSIPLSPSMPDAELADNSIIDADTTLTNTDSSSAEVLVPTVDADDAGTVDTTIEHTITPQTVSSSVE